jgi:tetratricopeptide (TPR) repeat protein
LSKEPQRRYTSAAALGDDLRRFEEGRPIQARPVNWIERLWRWGRRNPTGTALLVTALALIGLAGGGGVWLVQQRARRDGELRSDVGTAVDQAASLRRGFHFREARKLLAQARQRLEPAGPDDLRRRVDQGRADLDLVERLDTVRIMAATYDGGKPGWEVAEPLYASAFAAAGFGREGDEVNAVAARVRDSALRVDLIAALDDWASITINGRRRNWLLAVASAADQSPLRNDLRQKMERWRVGARMTQIVEVRTGAELSPQLATALVRAARASGGDAVPLLTAVQARYPQDFWLSYELGATMYEAQRWDEALGYYRAALAVRPDVGAANNGLGLALYAKDRGDEAAVYFEQAVSIDPKSVTAHINLGRALYDQGRLAESIGHFEQALRIAPEFVGTRINIGSALAATGRVDEAIVHLQHAVRLDPNSAVAHGDLGSALRAKGRLKEAIDHYQQSVRIDPKFAVSRYLLSSSLYDAARDAIRAAAGRDSENARLGEPERAAKRRQALAWLRDDLELTAKLLRDGRLSAQSIAPSQADPALASVRDLAALAKLPDAERESWQRFWADVAAVVAADPVVQGRAHAARRDWIQAADCYARGSTRSPTQVGHFWFEYAALLLLSGDRPGYVKACAHLVDLSGKDKEPRSYHVARACTLAPDAVADLSLPKRLAEKELQASREFWSLTEQGALAYRAGRFPEAAHFFEQSLNAEAAPGRAVLNWLWLALANQRLGKAEEALRWLGMAQAWLDQCGDGMPARAEEEGLHLHNWLEAHVLRREAEALISSEAPRSRTKDPPPKAPRQ